MSLLDNFLLLIANILPSIDFKKELRSLNGELQLHILELADILIERPSQYARRVEEISTVFKNLHHLLNSLRPHQVNNILDSYKYINLPLIWMLLVFFPFLKFSLYHVFTL